MKMHLPTVGRSLGVVATTAVLFLGIAVFVALTTRRMMVDEARNTVVNVVKATVGRIDNLSSSVECAVDNSVWVVQEHRGDPDYMYSVVRELVTKNRYIIGSAVAFVPGFCKNRGQLFSPYCNIDPTGGVRIAELKYDYAADVSRNDWFRVPVRTGRPYWCEPYFDDGGGEVMMCTYSVPVKDESGKVFAVLTADVSLADMTDFVSSLHPYADSYATLHSKAGKTLVQPPKSAKDRHDDVRLEGQAENGWTLGLVCPIANILHGAKRLVLQMFILSIVGLALIFFVSWSFSTRLQRATAANQRIESELSIANTIQMSLSDVTFPSYAAARMRPAKEVGGDRYDFSERGDVVYFSIGDASGKGVPAALYTTLVGACFNMAVDLRLPCGEYVSRVNGLVSDRNRNAMFVTYFAGILNRAENRLDFCNAGHNPPIIISPDGMAKVLYVRSNIALGVMDDFPYAAESVPMSVGSRLLVYTDGVTEAMNVAGEQFGVARLLAFAAAHAHDAPGAFVDALFAAVDAFAGGAEQADDITALLIDNVAKA